MLAKIFLIKGEYHLCLCNSKPQKLSLTELQAFLETFNDKNRYPGDDADNEYGVLSPATGELLAEVNKSYELKIISPKILTAIFRAGGDRYLTLDEYAEIVGRGSNIVGRMCREGRIPGAFKEGRDWKIPENAPYPPDSRKR